ncbi:MAG TPA: EamA family transporter [Woeseiaceae bacterium]|nr:EamA family transporter [Woeseiaceae bacterium]
MNNRALYLITVLIWGTTWIAIEFQLGEVAPGVSIFYRYTLAALLLFGWCGARGLPLGFDRGAHVRFALLGLLLFCLNYMLTYYAQVYITSALSAIAFSTMLWMNIVNSRLFFGTRAGARVLLGSVLGIAGIVVLFLPEVSALSLSDTTLYGAGLCVLGAYVSSLGNMVSQSAQQRRLPIVQSNAWGMLYGALFTGLLALAQGQAFTFDWSVGYVTSLLYLAVFGSIVAFGSYLTLLGRIGAHKAGYAVVMFPVVALAVSFGFEGLALTANIVLGVLLVMAGNVLILRRDRTAAPQARGYRSSTVADSP